MPAGDSPAPRVSLLDKRAVDKVRVMATDHHKSRESTIYTLKNKPEQNDRPSGHWGEGTGKLSPEGREIEKKE